MSEEEMKEAISSLLTLWRDVEWWEEQGLSQVRPTLKAAADAARQLAGERDEARAEVERLKNHIPAATKMIRPEPSRLEIAAMLQAGWLANPESEIDNQHDWWLAQADALIAAAKGGVE